MTDTNTDNTVIYVFLAVTIAGSIFSMAVGFYFSLRCQRARGEIPPEPLQEVIIVSPAVGVQAPLLRLAQDARVQALPGQPA
jgi:hypothetical protein